MLKYVYPSYESYAESDLEMLLKKVLTTKTQNWKASQLKSIVILSSDKGYDIKSLPDIAQRSPITKIHTLDIDSDGNKDLVLFGNRSKNALKLGRSDANYGTLLFGGGDGSFSLSSALKTGLSVKGDVSDVIEIDSVIYVAKSDQELSIYKLNSNEK